MENLNPKSLNLLKLVIVLSVFAFIFYGCGGGGGDGGDVGENEEQVSGTQAVQTMNGLSDFYREILPQNDEQTALDEAADWLRDRPEVVPESVAVHDRAINFIFIDGTPCVFFGYDLSSENSGAENVPLQMSSGNPASQLDEDVIPNLLPTSENSSGIPVVPYCKTSIILDAFYNADNISNAESVKDILDKIGYSSEYKHNEEVTLDVLRSMGSKGVIFFDTHGGTLSPDDVENLRKEGYNCEENDVFLISGQVVSSEKWDNSEPLRKNCKIFPAAHAEDNRWWWAVTPNFFKDVNFCENKLFYANACKSLVNLTMAEAVYNGDGAYYGWNRNTIPAADYKTILSFFEVLSDGNTVAYADSQDGSVDARYYGNPELRLTCDTISVYAQGPYEVWGGNSLCPPITLSDEGCDNEDCYFTVPGYMNPQECGYVKFGESNTTEAFHGDYKYFIIGTTSIFTLDAIQLPDCTFMNNVIDAGNTHMPFKFDDNGNLIGDYQDYNINHNYTKGPPDGLTLDVGVIEHPTYFKGFYAVENPVYP